MTMSQFNISDRQSAHERVREIVSASGTSFFWAMRLLPLERRQAIFAVYAFCRLVDDVADEEGLDADKRAELDQWRNAISGLFQTPQIFTPADENMAATLFILSDAIKDYGLIEADFQAVIDGMEMDAHGPVALETMDVLDLYCDRVASAVGRLCVPIFGQPDEKGRLVADHLGRALQLTNIIRDVPEDAEIKRLYLPQDLLAKYEMDNKSPDDVAGHPNLPKAITELGRLAQDRYDSASAAIADCDATAMRAPIVMMKVYYQNLKRLRSVDWQPQTLRTQGKLTKAMRKAEKLIIGLRYGLF